MLEGKLDRKTCCLGQKLIRESQGEIGNGAFTSALVDGMS